MQNTYKPIYYFICPKCNTRVMGNSSRNNCGDCGSALIKECPNCRSTIYSQRDKFCDHCGTQYVKNNL